MSASIGIRAGALVVCLACAGCLSLPKKTPPPTLYALDRAIGSQGAAAPRQALQATIAIDAPGGHVPVLGDELVWREKDTIAFVSGVGWSGMARAALQRMLVESARAAGAATTFANGEGGRATYLVRWEVSHFEVIADGSAPVAVLMLDAQLLSARTRELVGVRHVEQRETLADRSQTEAARALRAVAQVGSDELGQWVVQQAAAAQQATPALTQTAVAR